MQCENGNESVAFMSFQLRNDNPSARVPEGNVVLLCDGQKVLTGGKTLASQENASYASR